MSAGAEGKRVALVTGAARGIGAAVARRLGEAGYLVLGADVLDAEQETTYPLVRCDVADEAAVAALVQRALDDHGRIDVLVNVAGIVLVKPLEETDWEEYRRTVDVNLGGTFLLCKHCIPAMKAQGGGAIVNMASVSGHVGQVDHALYGATKGAVLALCRALAWELAPWEHPCQFGQPRLRGHAHAARRHPHRGREDRAELRRGEAHPRGRAGARPLGRSSRDRRGRGVPGRRWRVVRDGSGPARRRGLGGAMSASFPTYGFEPARLAERLRERGLAAALLTSPENVYLHDRLHHAAERRQPDPVHAAQPAAVLLPSSTATIEGDARLLGPSRPRGVEFGAETRSSASTTSRARSPGSRSS